jgi:hypothetical protein
MARSVVEEMKRDTGNTMCVFRTLAALVHSQGQLRPPANILRTWKWLSSFITSSSRTAFFPSFLNRCNNDDRKGTMPPLSLSTRSPLALDRTRLDLGVWSAILLVIDVLLRGLSRWVWRVVHNNVRLGKNVAERGLRQLADRTGSTRGCSSFWSSDRIGSQGRSLR